MSLPWKELSAPARLCIRIVKVPFAGKVEKDTFKDGAILWVYHIKVPADSAFLLWRQVSLAHIISFRKCDTTAISPCDNERIFFRKNLHIPKNCLPETPNSQARFLIVS